MSNRKERLSASVSPELKAKIESEALRRSEPGNRVTSSDVIREALIDHFEKVEQPAE